ncbi:unnamed protein product [Soboliphyme baturini]|uniref:Dual specificity protein phosphatase 15 n=1 Tax=Soboliphyme baturini TaxID=241478 RepID=A0A183IS93_9BILA|nr:unnamed protein product [Soboliphyme baturini]
MNQILPGLYVGSLFDALCESKLEKYEITHIVSVHDGARKFSTQRPQLVIKVSDTHNEDMVKLIPVVNDFVHQARCNGGSVLIHCLLGISRSVTLVVAYIMTVTSFGWRHSLNIVRSARHKANPNIGFKKQLQLFENAMLENERTRLKQKFAEQSLLIDDERHCRRLLDSYHRWIQFGDRLCDEQEAIFVQKLADAAEVPV